MLKKITAAVLCLAIFMSLCGCTPKAGKWPLSDYLEIMETESPQVAALFPTLPDDSPLIAEQYITYDMGQYIAYVNVEFGEMSTDAFNFETETARIQALVTDSAYADDAVVDDSVVPGAVKYSLIYSRAVEAYMFGSGLYAYALVYEAQQRIVYVAVSENPEYTYAQFIPEPYYVIDDLHASAEATLDTAEAQ